MISKKRMTGGANVLFALAVLLSFAWAPVGFAQDGFSYIRMIRTIEADESGESSPAGLAFSSQDNAFYVAGAPAQGQAAPASTEIVTLTPFGDPSRSSRIDARVTDPINVAFDSKANRLLILQPSTNRLLQIAGAAGGALDSRALTSSDTRDLGLQSPRGMSVDQQTGRVFILDAAGPRILQAGWKADGSLDQAQIRTVDLRPAGLGDVRGLAFDPNTGHLHLVSLSEQRLVEFTPTGQVVARRDLAEFQLRNPQGLLFAPSGDQTDDPSEISLFLADAGDGTAAGRIFEFTFTQPVAPSPNVFNSSIVRTTDLGAISPPSPDPSGLTYVPNGNKLMMSDGEVEETVSGITHWEGANVWELTLTGGVLRTGNVSKKITSPVQMSDEPVGVTWNPNDGHFFFSEDGGKRVYNLDPGADGMPGTAGDTWTFFSTNGAGNGDPEGVTFDTWNNRLFVADGVNREVYQYTLAGSLVSHFDVQGFGVEDPETVEFNPDSGTLFVMSSSLSTPIIVETTLSGALIQTIDISPTNARQAAGLAYAPASNGSGEKRFYIVDRGIDNNANPNIVDGKLFEMTTPSSSPPADRPPVANDDSASTTENNAVNINVAANDTDPDGNLSPASANSITNPASGSLNNNGNGTFTYTPNPGFTGSDGFNYEICDTTSLCDTAQVSITVSTLGADLIFSDGFESGNLLAWTSNKNDLGDLSVSAAAALAGNSGMQGVLDDNVTMYVTDDTPAAEPRYRVRFYFDPNSIPMASSDNHFIFYGYTGTTPAVLRVQFRFYNGGYQMRAALRDDGSTWRNTLWSVISDAPHAVELDWRAATAPGASNGALTFWIDGLQKGNLANVDNDARRIDRVRLGPVGGVDNGTRGTYFFDAFESRRQTYIGP